MCAWWWNTSATGRPLGPVTESAASSATAVPNPLGSGNVPAPAPALLSELMDKSRTSPEGDIACVVNLSRLPHTPDDLISLDEALGQGGVTVLSCG